MKLKPIAIVIAMVIVFALVFLMNYLGNDAEDKTYRAALNAFAGAVGAGIGLWFMGRAKDDDKKNPDFD